MAAATPRFTFIVDHLDPELEAWQILEYHCIHSEALSTGNAFILSGVTPSLLHPSNPSQPTLTLPSTAIRTESVDKLYSTPDARSRVCLLDPRGSEDLSPKDGEEFDVFLFGGILGDDPPRDRTAELRKLGFAGRRLGPEQLTTDTAARVTRIVVQEGKRLDEIGYVDRPEIVLDAKAKDGVPSESISMPFKYVKGSDGGPILPEGMLRVMEEDLDKGISDLL